MIEQLFSDTMGKTTAVFLFIFSVLLGTTVTAFLIESRIDWKWAVYFNEHEILVWMGVPFVFLGMIVPALIPIYFFLQTKKAATSINRIQFLRSLYSFILSYAVMTLLKVFTNRVDMEPFEPIGIYDFSDQFRFGFMNSNSWWESFSEGWPSGHTLIATAMSVSIQPFLKNRSARIINVFYPIIIGLSVSTAFHWLSDVVSGALIGLVIGLYYAKYIPQQVSISDQ